MNERTRYFTINGEDGEVLVAAIREPRNVKNATDGHVVARTASYGDAYLIARVLEDNGALNEQ